MISKKLILLLAVLLTGLVLYGCGGGDEEGGGEGNGGEGEGHSGEPEVLEEPQIYNIDEVVINPANTAGQRLLLVSLALQVPTASDLLFLEENDLIFRDIVITTLTSKTLRDLSQPHAKDSLKADITENIYLEFEEDKPELEITNIFFTRFVMQ